MGMRSKLGNGIAVGVLLIGLAVLGQRALDLQTERMTVSVDGIPLQVEVATTPAARGRGLMYRADLATDAGMLFVWPEPQPLEFWMKNTLIDLDVGFFDAQGRLLNVATMRARDEGTRHRSAAAARYGLEVNAGWFASHGIQPEAQLRLPRTIDAR